VILAKELNGESCGKIEQGKIGRDMATILLLHGWHSVPGGVKPTYPTCHGHAVANPALDVDDFKAAVRTAEDPKPLAAVLRACKGCD
jgi:hypothetical protein